MLFAHPDIVKRERESFNDGEDIQWIRKAALILKYPEPKFWSNRDDAKAFALASAWYTHYDIKFRDFRYWYISKKLGEGSYGEVYLIVDPQGKEYAIKLFGVEFYGEYAPRMGDNEFKDYQDRFSLSFVESWYNKYGLVDEVTMAEIKKSKEPKQLLMQNYGYGVTMVYGKTYVYSLLEYIRGTSLTKFIECGMTTDWRLSQKQFLRFATILFNGLCQLHTIHLVHLDINPNNIMFTGDVLKLVDYGFSCAWTESPVIDLKCSWAQSTVNPPEFSDEQRILTEQEATAIDVWCTAYSILALLTIGINNRLFGVSIPDDRDLLKQDLEERIEFAKQRYELPEIFLQAMEEDPTKRPTSCQVFETMRKLF